MEEGKGTHRWRRSSSRRGRGLELAEGGGGYFIGEEEETQETGNRVRGRSFVRGEESRAGEESPSCAGGEGSRGKNSSILWEEFVPSVGEDSSAPPTVRFWALICEP